MKFEGFVGPAYQSRSVAINSQRCVNLYLEIDDSNGKTPLALHGMPGLVSLVTPQTGEVRGMHKADGRCFAVVGNTLYEISSTFTATSRGTLATQSGPVGMEDNGAQLVIVDGDGYVLTLSSNAFAQITDADFPSDVRTMTYQDGYFIVVQYGTQKFYISNDGASWDALDFASAEGLPDDLLSCISVQRSLYLLGESSVEAWSNTGATDFPFERVQGSFIETGLAAMHSPAKLDGGFFFLGNDSRGAIAVYRIDNFAPNRVSNAALEYQLSTYSTIADAVGYGFNLPGHPFYVLTFPIAGKTWVYDASTNAWFEWLYWSNGGYEQHRVNCVLYCFGVLLGGDRANGKIYRIDETVYTDDGIAIRALRSTPIVGRNEKLVTHAALQVLMQSGVGLTTGQGSDPQVMMRFSDDGGQKWSNERTASIGKIGKTKDRAIFRRLGQARNRVYEVSITDPVKRVIVGAELE